MNSHIIHVMPLKKNDALSDTRRSIFSMIKPDNMNAGTSTALVRIKLRYLSPLKFTEFIDSP